MVTLPKVMNENNATKTKQQQKHKRARGGGGGGNNPQKEKGGGGGAGGGNKKQHQKKASAPQVHQPPPMNRSSATPSPKSCYAASKCYEPPTPESLPKPPTAWTGMKAKTTAFPSPLQDLVNSMQKQEQTRMDSRDVNSSSSDEAVNRHLKMLLKVNA